MKMGKYSFPDWIKTSKNCKLDEVMYIYEPTPTTQTIIYPTSSGSITTPTIYQVTTSNWFDALAGGLAGSSVTSSLNGMAAQYRTATSAGQQFQYNYQYISSLTDGWYANALGSLLGGSQPPETPEEKASRLKREVEREAKRKAASLRAEHLLFTILTPSQVKQYTDDDFIELMVKGRTYRIRKGYSRNVELIEAGKPTVRYCAHPEDAHVTPVPDAMLAQLLMLQNNEAEFLKVANRTLLQ
jgi:hypothetical protein